VFQKIFDEVVFNAINLKMVTGKILYIYSTHLKANANKRKLVKIEVDKTPKEYDDVVKFTKTDKGRNIHRRRKETIERSFADSKQLHGLRYCHMRGLENVVGNENETDYASSQMDRLKIKL